MGVRVGGTGADGVRVRFGTSDTDCDTEAGAEAVADGDAATERVTDTLRDNVAVCVAADDAVGVRWCIEGVGETTMGVAERVGSTGTWVSVSVGDGVRVRFGIADGVELFVQGTLLTVGVG